MADKQKLACEDLEVCFGSTYRVAACSACSEPASKEDLGLSAEDEAVEFQETFEAHLWDR